MSRIGKQPIIVPNGVTVRTEGQAFFVKSAKGELQVPIPADITVTTEGNQILVAPRADAKGAGALWGLTRALINNAVTGVSTGWKKVLEVRGVGYRAQLKGTKLDLSVGQSHPIEVEPPEGISFGVSQENVEGENIHVVEVKGIDKQLVGDVSANIREFRPPEPYKGKGIRYRGEYVRRKAGKATG